MARNWDFLRKQKAEDSVGYRDVYEGQSLERSKMEGKQSPRGIIIGCVVMFIVIFVFTWMLFSIPSSGNSSEPVVAPYIGHTNSKTRYYEVDENNEPVNDDVFYRSLDEAQKNIAEPKWHKEAVSEAEVEMNSEDAPKNTFVSNLFKIGPWKIWVSIIFNLAASFILFIVLRQQLDAQNLMQDKTDINQHENDQHIMVPNELFETFDFFPDTGYHSDVSVTAMISHVAIDNEKCLDKVSVAKRYDKDVLDEDGDIEFYKGEIMYDDDGEIIYNTEKVFDDSFAEDLFEASGAPEDKKRTLFRKRYKASQIKYNPGGKNRDKLGDYDTLADLINADWEFPWYEVQRAAGAYIVDTSPSNTMVVAMTRAGKGRETRSLVKSLCTRNLFTWRTNILTNLRFAIISDMIIL